MRFHWQDLPDPWGESQEHRRAAEEARAGSEDSGGHVRPKAEKWTFKVIFSPRFLMLFPQFPQILSPLELWFNRGIVVYRYELDLKEEFVKRTEKLTENESRIKGERWDEVRRPSRFNQPLQRALPALQLKRLVSKRSLLPLTANWRSTSERVLSCSDCR